jgi:xanthine dehydrogenase accessory factor
MIAGTLARTAQRLRADGEPYVHATVVRAQHPTSVHAGDAALVHPDGTIDGFVGGQCAQQSVRQYAARVLATGEPLLLRIVPDPEGEVAEDLGDGTVVAHNPCLSGGAFDVFLEPWLPAPRMVVAGDAPMARALGDLARAAGYDVVHEGEPQPGDAAVVVASHGQGEETMLERALLAGVPYVALVASRRRGEAVRKALAVPEDLRARVRVPAGLDIGARTPTEVAVSILAQLIAERGAAGPPTEAVALPATAIDPVCGMEVQVGGSTPHLDVDGERLWFCCEGCRTAYADDR